MGSSTAPDEEMEIKLTGDAFDIPSRARKEGESLSGVVIRLSAATLEGLQRRGEKEVATSDGERLVMNVDQDKSLGAMSCVSMASSVFSYDVTQEGLWRKRGEPLGMKDIGKGEGHKRNAAPRLRIVPVQGNRLEGRENWRDNILVSVRLASKPVSRPEL